MDLNFFTVTKTGLGLILGISLGFFLRFLVIKILIIVSIPAIMLLGFDYLNLYEVNWLKLDEGFQSYVVPPVTNAYSYLNDHSLMGIIPGICIGFGVGFVFSKRR